MPFQKMSTYPLVVAQYRIVGHPRRTEHWSLIAKNPKGEEAHVYEVVGGYDSFLYNPRRAEATDIGRSETLRGGCKVGDIPASSLDWMAIKLQDVQVIRNNPDFDCQTWVMNAIWLLKETGMGIIDSHVNERFIRDELKLEDERWEVADRTLFERM